MKNGLALALRLAKWLVGPLAVLVLSAGLANLQASRRSQFSKATASLSKAEKQQLEAAPALAVANATWAFGSVDSVRKMVRTELGRLSDAEGARRARVFLRFGIIDTNPDGQAAVFFQACSSDPSICDHMKEAAERETAARLVAPGNHLPLFFLGGHP